MALGLGENSKMKALIALLIFVGPTGLAQGQAPVESAIADAREESHNPESWITAQLKILELHGELDAAFGAGRVELVDEVYFFELVFDGAGNDLLDIGRRYARVGEHGDQPFEVYRGQILLWHGPVSDPAPE